MAAGISRNCTRSKKDAITLVGPPETYSGKAAGEPPEASEQQKLQGKTKNARPKSHTPKPLQISEKGGRKG
ncbi:Hypothetical predicted protein, partial [Pelobates cultripes]